MSKFQAVRQFVGTASADRRRAFARPKIHILGDQERIQSANVARKSRSGSKPEETELQKILGYHGAKKLSATVHFVALIMMSVMIFMETRIYNVHPTATTVEDDAYPVQKIDFPGVSICNLNIVSRREAMNFAETIWMKEGVQEIANITLEKVKYLIKYMGALYQFEHKEQHPGDMLLLHEVLQKAFARDYNVMSIMKKLSPKCHSFLTDCYWQGLSRKCVDLFVSRWTPEGHCCTFNHVRWNDRFYSNKDEGFKIGVERARIAGTEFGLSAFLKPDLADYYYTILPGKGFKVLFSTASDYPDAPSGGLREVLLSPGSESFLTIRATSFYSTPEVIKYDKQKRKCLFKNELDEVYGGSYSYSQCMMFCRVADVRKKCGCIPFFYPRPDNLSHVRSCTVKDSKCLQRFKYKWWSVEPGIDEDADHSNRDMNREVPDENLRCDCWPSCENVGYTIYKSGSNIHQFPMAWTSCENKNVTPDDIVLVVSFESTGTVRLKQDVMFFWYDLMGNYGGLCSLFLGISIMTPIELVYLLCSRLWQRRRDSREAKGKKKSRSRNQRWPPVKIMTHDRPIFWDEITPGRR